MKEAIYCEFYKLRKTKIYPITIIAGMFFPVLLIISSIWTGFKYDWKIYIAIIKFIMFSTVSISLFTLVSAFVFSREYTEKTSNVLFSYPISKGKIFISKLFVIFSIIFLVYLVQFILVFGVGSFLKQGMFTTYYIQENFKVYGLSLLFQFSIIPFSILFSNITRSIMLPVVYSIIIFIINLFLIIVDASKFSFVPTLLPMMPELLENGNNGSMKYSYISAIISFVVGFFISYKQYLFSDHFTS